MDFQGFLSAISQIADEKGLSQERVLETVEHALASAYKKEYGKKGQVIKAKINSKGGKIDFWRVRGVVDDTMVYIPEKVEVEGEEPVEQEEIPEKVKDSYRPTEAELNAVESEREGEESERRVRYNAEKHILIEESKEIDPKLKAGDELVIPLEAREDFGRIAAQTA